MNLTTLPRPNSRRTGRFGLRVAAASVAMASLIGAAAGSASADLPLQGNKATITQTGLERHGTWARLEWTANVSWMTVMISTTPPTQNGNGRWVPAGDVTYANVNKLHGKFHYYAKGLTPKTTYHVILASPDEGNLDSTQAVGQFTTLKPTITATFDEIHVSNDGDGGLKGAGDLWWYFDTSFSPWKDGWHRSTSSGGSFAVPADRGTLGAINPTLGKTVTVTLQAAEDDVDGWDFGCSGLFDKWVGEPRTDSTDCAQMAFAQADVELPTYVNEEQPKPFTATTGESSRTPVWFTVSGTIQVTYS